MIRKYGIICRSFKILSNDVREVGAQCSGVALLEDRQPVGQCSLARNYGTYKQRLKHNIIVCFCLYNCVLQNYY